jgi:hypothetical protein
MQVNQEPPMEEVLVVETVSNLRKLAEVFGYEFEETIYHIEKLYNLKKPVVAWDSLTQDQKLERERELIEEQAYLEEVSAS